MNKTIRYLYLLSLLFALLLTRSAIAFPQYDLSQVKQEQVIYSFAEVEGGIGTKADISSLLNASIVWKDQYKKEAPVLTKGDNWLAFDLYNEQPMNHMFYLTIDKRIKMASSRVYIQYEKHPPVETQQSAYQANVQVIPFSIEPQSKVRVYLYVHAKDDFVLSAKVLSSHVFVSYIKNKQFINGIAIGGCTAAAFMTFFLYLANRSRKSLVLCGYIVTQSLLLSVILGFDILANIPFISVFKEVEISTLTALSFIFLFEFVVKLFALQELSLKVSRFLRALSICLLIYVPISIFLPISANLFITLLLTLLASAVLIVVGIYMIRDNQRLSRLFTLVMSIQLCFSIANILWNNNGQDLDFYAQNINTYSVSCWINILFVSFLLNREHYYQVQDRDVMQKNALENATASKDAKEALLALQEESQEQLETRVQERTMELNIALQELESANKELEEKNTRDELTGLYNRRYYDQKILAEYRRSRRNLTPLSIVVVDIDHFKNVNDTYGHLGGDQCIVAIANSIKACLGRSSDIACRYGGEEFCLILPETDTSGAYNLAEALRESIEKSPLYFQEKQIKITISAGVSTYNQQNSVNVEHLFTAADKALYQAKSQGRNQVQKLCVTQVITA